MLLEVFDPAGASMGGYGLEAHFDGGYEKFTASFNSTDRSYGASTIPCSTL